MAASKKRENDNLTIDTNWTLPMIKEFIETLMDVTLCSDVQELKNHIILDCIWKEVESKLHIDSELLKNFWYHRLHLQLFCRQPIYLTDIKIKLIEYLYERGISNTGDIKWHNVISCLDGTTTIFLYRIFNNLIKFARLRSNNSQLADLIPFLYNNYIPYLISIPKDKILPRLMYDNGSIAHVESDLEQMSLESSESDLRVAMSED